MAAGGLTTLRRATRAAANKERATSSAWFFKTGPGEYGEGDRFLGVTMPELRRLLRAHAPGLARRDADELLRSPLHEERMLGALLYVRLYEDAAKRGDDAARDVLARGFQSRLRRLSNWDLVDVTVPRVLGRHLLERVPRRQAMTTLRALAASRSLWERRSAMLATLAFTVSGDPRPCFAIADELLGDREDLMHKAVGWMLREAGKRCGNDKLAAYLAPRLPRLPRTALRYAIERFPERERTRFLRGEV